MADFFQRTGQGYVLRLTVVPGAQRTVVVGLHGDRLKVRLAAPPEKGAANQELIAFLAKTLHLPKQAFELTVGASSRVKMVEVHDRSPDLAARLRLLVPTPPPTP
ncbi:MAG: DUF167 domain-containing protein [Desulfobaccales bacterium]